MLGLASVAELFAAQVDSELVILVDVTGSVSNTEFANVMESLASSFESSSIINSISSGAIGSVAATLVFWSTESQQQVGVSWLQITDVASATQFAASVRSAERPFRGRSSIAGALSFGASLFGSETGGADNGFESGQQMISLWGDGRDNNTSGSGTRAEKVQDARDAALAAGVDEISAVLINNRSTNVESYYESNIIGSNGEGAPVLSVVDIDDIDQAIINASLSGSIERGAAVPEPSVVFLFAFAGLFTLKRKR